jgi:hypothetical protein
VRYRAVRSRHDFERVGLPLLVEVPHVTGTRLPPGVRSPVLLVHQHPEKWKGGCMHRARRGLGFREDPIDARKFGLCCGVGGIEHEHLPKVCRSGRY